MTIKDLLKAAADNNASDLHLVVGVCPTLRIDGQLADLAEVGPISKKQMEELILSMLSPEQKERFFRKRNLDLGYEIEGVRFRVNLLYEKGNFGLVARVINEKMPSLDEIGMPKIVYDLLGLQQGLILVTGPTGCGKSTALAAMINYINTNRRCHIITFEDPIEYQFKPEQSIIIQRQLGTDMMSFSDGLKHALRQDPNVIMVGEMRDLETIATTITLAETGHLVLATLHTYNAAQTIDRIIDIFPSHQQAQVRMQVSMTLASVISQRLLPKEEGGRVAAREILINTPASANLIRENKIAQIRTVIETGAKDGMMSMDQDLKRLYEEKIINRQTAVQYMTNPELLGRLKTK